MLEYAKPIVGHEILPQKLCAIGLRLADNRDIIIPSCPEGCGTFFRVGSCRHVQDLWINRGATFDAGLTAQTARALYAINLFSITSLKNYRESLSLSILIRFHLISSMSDYAEVLVVNDNGTRDLGSIDIVDIREVSFRQIRNAITAWLPLLIEMHREKHWECGAEHIHKPSVIDYNNNELTRRMSDQFYDSVEIQRFTRELYIELFHVYTLGTCANCTKVATNPF